MKKIIWMTMVLILFAGCENNMAKKYETRKGSIKTWEEVFENGRDISVETLCTGYISGDTKKIVHFQTDGELKKNYEKKKARLPVLSHLVKHNNKYYLIDTGFSSRYSSESGGEFKGIFKKQYFKDRYFLENGDTGIDKQVEKRGIKIDTVFLTHFHEHISGAYALEAINPSTKFVYGKGEGDAGIWPFVYSDYMTNLKNKAEIDFEDGTEMPMTGKCIDVFGDGALWAISTKGHSKGHISYLINGRDKKILIMGDLSVSEFGYKNNLETGSYSEDMKEGRKSFERISGFLMKYKEIVPVFGHEDSSKYVIEYTLNP